MSNRSGSPDRTEEARWTRLDARQTKSTRTTCDLCQKRKVRCDRTKPRCLRCLRGGQICTYPVDETSRINTELQTLQSRLGLAEEKLAEHGLSLQSDSAVTSVPNLSCAGRTSQQPLHVVMPKHTPFSNPDEREDGDFHFNFNDWNPAAVFDIFQQCGAESSQLAPELGQLDVSQNVQPSYSRTHAHTLPHNTPRGSPVGTGQLDKDLTRELSQVYFDSVQSYFPLLYQDDFLMLNTFDALAVAALKSAICMAGAQMIQNVCLERRFYLESRANLEKAELHDDASQFVTLESAQTLLLLARYELTHGASQRALMTMARLAQLLLILYPRALVGGNHRDRSGSPSSVAGHSSITAVDSLIQSTHPERSKRRLVLLAFSLYYIMPHELAHEALFANNSFDPDIFPRSFVSQETLDGNVCLNKIDGDDTEDIATVFFVARLYAAVRRHYNKTTAIVEGAGTLNYNVCLTHETLEAQIDTLLATISPTPSNEGPQQQQQCQNNFKVLPLLIALGARILLYTTAPITAKKAAFLRAVVPECKKIAVITANDLCATLSQSGLLRTDRASEFRELRIFLMPMLLLAADAQLSMLEEEENQAGHKFYVIGSETKKCLEIVTGAMEPWKEDAAVYASCVAKCRSFLHRQQNDLKNRRARDYLRRET